MPDPRIALVMPACGLVPDPEQTDRFHMVVALDAHDVGPAVVVELGSVFELVMGRN